MSEHSTLLRLLKCIDLLSSEQGKSISQIANILGTSSRTVYRYMDVLEETGFCIDKNFNGRFFIHQPVSKSYKPGFTVEEVNYLRQVMGIGKESPVRDSILKKLFEQSPLPPMQDMIVRAHLIKIVEEIGEAIEGKRQIILHHYHSSSSSEIHDRLVEPVEITDRYNTLLAYEPKSELTKFFKLDRMSGVTVLDRKQKYTEKHKHIETDMFGMGGEEVHWVGMELSLRAYNLLREEHPVSVDYLTVEENRFIFHGPVRGWEGIGRFIMGLPGEILRIDHPKLKEYIYEMNS